MLARSSSSSEGDGLEVSRAGETMETLVAHIGALLATPSPLARSLHRGAPYFSPESPSAQQVVNMSVEELEQRAQEAEARAAELGRHARDRSITWAYAHSPSGSPERGIDRGESTAASLLVSEQLPAALAASRDKQIGQLAGQVDSALQYVDGLSVYLDDLDGELLTRQEELDRVEREKQACEAGQRAAEKAAADADRARRVLQSRLAEISQLQKSDSVALRRAAETARDTESRLRDTESRLQDAESRLQEAVHSDNQTARKMVLFKGRLEAEQAAHAGTKAAAEEGAGQAIDELTALLQLASSAVELQLAASAELA